MNLTIKKIKKILSDGSKVWDVEIYENGKFLAEFNCDDEYRALGLANEMNRCINTEFIKDLS